MANSIKKNYPQCNIIMCYFHLKSNMKQIELIPRVTKLLRETANGNIYFNLMQIKILNIILNKKLIILFYNRYFKFLGAIT